MSPKRRTLQYIAAYLLWVISTGLGFYALYLARETLLVAMVVSSGAGELTNSEQFYQSLRVAAASHWSILFLGMFMIVLLVAFEHFYRTGVSIGKLWHRFFLVTWVEGVVLLATHLTYIVLRSSFVPVRWWTIAILVAEGIAAGLFLLLWRNSRKVPNGIRI